MFGGEERMTVRGPRDINTPRSRTVTVIFQSSEPPRKTRNFQTLKSMMTVARTVGTSEIKLGTSEQGNNRGITTAGLSP
jgi:hypothetical protein